MTLLYYLIFNQIPPLGQFLHNRPTQTKFLYQIEKYNCTFTNSTPLHKSVSVTLINGMSDIMK